MTDDAGTALGTLTRAGLAAADADAWWQARPVLRGEFEADALVCWQHWARSQQLLSCLPSKPQRRAHEAAAAQTLLTAAAATREAFLVQHVVDLYARLTSQHTRFLPVHELVYAASALVPGLTPTPAQVTSEACLRQADKDGIEFGQGVLLAHVLAQAQAGLHLCQAMLLPRPESLAQLHQLQATGSIDLGAASVETVGAASWVTLKNPKTLNAEDQNTIDAVEQAVDLALLDTRAGVAVLRGCHIDHPKYAGRRVFCSGINLTDLYHGKIPYLWYIQREMGFVNKLFRGLAYADRPADEVSGATLEKPWIAQLDSFAIGGGCQYLLATDYVVAGSDAYLTLPARKEGIVPGAANLRLPRFVGDRLARQLIMMERQLDCASAEGRLICDEVVAPDQVEAAVADVVARMTSSGVVSAAANRRAFRVAHEPLDLFRRYMAVYARDQAACHFSPALISNLEAHWQAQTRRT
ncbi:MAG: enoyl-CoA hydratase/isomerase family protein [Rhodoferax sp.]|nr:enoyl-CoA hydratase/isomerase family protein [Rhodoferax sp.]